MRRMVNTNSDRRRAQLREFLTARRAAITPESVGLAAGRRRRTPGLRREELAALAGVGVTWYTWLEQGRDIRTSPDTLARIASALRLSETDTAHLFFLAGVGRPEGTSGERKAALDESIRAILDAFQAPAFVVGPSWDVEAFNDVADRIFGFRGGSGPFARNHLWRFFMDARGRALYLNWEALAETAVGLCRTTYARRDHDEYFDRMVKSLLEGSPVFAQLWRAQRTAPMTPARAQLLVSGVGEIHVTSVRLPLPGWDDHLLFLLPPSDRESQRLLARLARPSRTPRTPSPARHSGKRPERRRG